MVSGDGSDIQTPQQVHAFGRMRPPADDVAEEQNLVRLPRIFQNGYELSIVLRALDPARQQQLIDWLGWDDVVALVHDRRDLAHMLRALPSELSNRLLNHWTRDQLWDIIRDERGWQYLYNNLEAEEAEYLGRLLEVDYA